MVEKHSNTHGVITGCGSPPLLHALHPQNRYTALNIDRHGLAAPLSLSVSRLRRWRALVRKREPIVVEHEPTAWTIVAKREPEPAAVGEPDADGCRAATVTPLKQPAFGKRGHNI